MNRVERSLLYSEAGILIIELMIRTLFVGDLTKDSHRRDRAVELMAQSKQFGIEPLEATLKLVSHANLDGRAVDPSAWWLSETVHRIRPWLGSSPSLIVGFDPLHTAIAKHLFPGTPAVLHIDGVGSGVPKLSINGASMLPGLHEVITGTLRSASYVFVSNPRNVAALQKQPWGVEPLRIQQAPVEIGWVGPLYLEAARAGYVETPARFHWWLDLWPIRTEQILRLA